MTSWLYITQSVPWILVGLVVGWFMGRSTVAVEVIADAVHDDEVDDMSGNDRSNNAEPRHARFTTIHALGLVVVLLGIFTAVQGYVQGEATARLVDCHRAYSTGFADAIDARSRAAADSQAALDDLLMKVSLALPNTESGGEQVRIALTDYLKKREEAKKTQAENPYPPAPRDLCKEP